jgi:hypothetical protein
MQIARLAVSGVGRFADETVVEGFAAGVNVLAAPNEAGKSTLFKALRLCVFERHKAKTREIEALRTTGANLPISVTLDFSHDGRNYRIAKTYLRGASASLIEDGREIAKGAAADEMLWEILGIEPLNNRSVDHAAFAMLWVGQRGSFELPSITKAGETALSSAVEAEVGAMTGSEQAKAVLSETRAELDKYLTGTGKEATQGPIAHARRQLKELRSERNRYAERLKLLEEQFARLEEHRLERARLADPAQTAQDEKGLEAARLALAAALEAKAKLDRYDAEERRFHTLVDGAEAKKRELTKIADAIDDMRKRDKVLTENIAATTADENQFREQLSKLKDQLKEISEEDEASSARERLLQQLDAAAERARSKAGLERTADQLRTILKHQRRVWSELETIKVTPKRLRELEEADRELSLLDARLDAAAARMTITVMRKDAGVEIGGRPALDGETIAITEPIRVAFGDAAALTLAPPRDFGKDQEKAREALQRRRRDLLTATECASLDQARSVFEKRGNCEVQLKGIEAELTALSVRPEEGEAALADLLGRIALAEAEIAKAMGRADTAELPDAVMIAAERRELAEGAEQRRKTRRTLERASLEPQKLIEELAQCRARASGELDALHRDLAVYLAVLPDATRSAALNTASEALAVTRKAHAQAAGALADMREKSPSAEECEQRANAVTRLEQAKANGERRLAELDRMISNLEGQVQSAGGDGLGERLAALDSQLAEAEDQVRRHEKRVAVLRLLADTISEALDASRERFQAPVLRRIKPYVNDLFPGAALALGEGYAVEGLARNGRDPERFELLSDGTQEQIAVLVRLALGTLLAEQGKSAPIIFDDALVFSDDERIARMFDALARGGASQQIVVLTCRMRAFEKLGGQTLRMVQH